MSVSLRVAAAADSAPIAEIYAPIVARTTISFEIEPPDATEIARRIVTGTAQWPWLVADDGVVAGYAYASQHRARAAYRWSVDVSVYVAERARRTGVGRRLYRALFAILGEQGYYGAFAGVTLPNEASQALHRAMGFIPVGVYRNVGYKLGAWHDVAWWQYTLREPTVGVTEPVPFAALRDEIASIIGL